MYQFFIDKMVPEKQIIEFVEDEFGVLASTFNFDKSNSIAYVQIIEYRMEFPLAINISFNSNFDLNNLKYKGIEDIALKFAKKFHLNVIFDLPDPVDGFSWKKITFTGEVYLIKVQDFEEGVKVEEKLFIGFMEL